MARGQPKQARKNVGVKAVAVDQIGPELAKKCAPALETGLSTPRRFAQIEVKRGNRGGPLCCKARHQHQQCDGVAARGHAIRYSQRLLFCPAHAERREQVDDTHGTRALLRAYLCLKIDLIDDSADFAAMAGREKRSASGVSSANSPGPRIMISSAANQ
jgi:hypothetical protein